MMGPPYGLDFWGWLSVVPFFILAGVLVSAGRGLWKLRNWARTLIILLAFLALLYLVLGTVASYLFPNALDSHSLVRELMNVAICPALAFSNARLIFFWLSLMSYSLVVWYLFRPRVKQAFGVS